MMAQPTVVIVVDDNAGLLKSLARLLAHHGIDSRTFASAEALLESLRTCSFGIHRPEQDSSDLCVREDR
jgi:FixJ family two-component response regulator